MAIVFDTQVTYDGNGVNSDTFASLTTAEANEGLISFHHFSNGTPSGVTFSGGTGLSWTKIGTEITVPTAGGELYAYYAFAASVQTGVSITATFTGGGFPQATGVLMAFKGVKTSGAFVGDDGNGTTVGTGVNAPVTTTADNSLVICGCGQTANVAMTPGANQTEAIEVTVAGGAFSRCSGQYRTATTPTSGTEVQMNNTTATDAPRAMITIELLEEVVAAVTNRIFMTTNTKFF